MNPFAPNSRQGSWSSFIAWTEWVFIPPLYTLRASCGEERFWSPGRLKQPPKTMLIFTLSLMIFSGSPAAAAPEQPEGCGYMPEIRVGFIGLGLMGRPMTRRLMDAGYPAAVANRSRPAVEALAAEGAIACDSPAEVADRSGVVFTMLPDAPQVEEVVFGPDGLAASMHEGSVLIDSTSNSPRSAEKVAAALAGRGVEMLDAPVSGAPEGAEQGTLAIMAGGPKATFERCRSLLEILGQKVVHVGEPPGSGCVAKLANQILVGLTFLGVGEAMVFGAKAGLDPAALVEAMGAGLARCGALEVKAPKILSGDFTPGGKVVTHTKDLRYAMEKAIELNVPLPGTALVAQMFSELRASGEGELDHIAIVRTLERMARVEARSKK